MLVCVMTMKGVLYIPASESSVGEEGKQGPALHL